MKLFIRSYNDACGCHPEIRHQIVVANSREDAEKMVMSLPANKCDYGWEEYEIEEGYITEVG